MVILPTPPATRPRSAKLSVVGSPPGTFRKLGVPYFGVLIKKDPAFQGTLLRSPIFGHPPPDRFPRDSPPRLPPLRPPPRGGQYCPHVWQSPPPSHQQSTPKAISCGGCSTPQSRFGVTSSILVSLLSLRLFTHCRAPGLAGIIRKRGPFAHQPCHHHVLGAESGHAEDQLLGVLARHLPQSCNGELQVLRRANLAVSRLIHGEDSLQHAADLKLHLVQHGLQRMKRTNMQPINPEALNSLDYINRTASSHALPTRVLARVDRLRPAVARAHSSLPLSLGSSRWPGSCSRNLRLSHKGKLENESKNEMDLVTS